MQEKKIHLYLVVQNSINLLIGKEYLCIKKIELKQRMKFGNKLQGC
jgi:hypothetical protein